MNRRGFLKYLGIGSASIAAGSIIGSDNVSKEDTALNSPKEDAGDVILKNIEKTMQRKERYNCTYFDLQPGEVRNRIRESIYNNRARYVVVKRPNDRQTVVEFPSYYHPIGTTYGDWGGLPREDLYQAHFVAVKPDYDKNSDRLDDQKWKIVKDRNGHNNMMISGRVINTELNRYCFYSSGRQKGRYWSSFMANYDEFIDNTITAKITGKGFVIELI